MTEFFSIPENRAVFEAEWPKWLKTPFVKGAAICGAGVDCVHLNAAIYMATRFLSDFTPPSYTLDGGRHNARSQVLAWLAVHGDFLHCKISPPKLGDTVVFHQRGKSEHHVGLVVGGMEFIHAVDRFGVIKARLDHSIYRQSLAGIFRPITP